MLILNLYLKKQMDVQKIQQVLQQQKQASIFLADIQCQLYGYLIILKTSIFYTVENEKNFCISLREHAMNVINFEKKKMLQLTKEELKSYQKATVCDIYRKRILKKFAND